MDDLQEPPLTPELLRRAYANGYFPMPHPDTGEILWFHPDPRAILPLGGFHVSRSLRRTLKRSNFTITADRDFAGVMDGCAEREDTWIDARMRAAYIDLHAEGDAHSIEVWQGDHLVGGVYGVCLRGAFFAESKFHRVTDASKVALFHLEERLRIRGFELLEVQFMTPHLKSLGVVEISRTDYLQKLARALKSSARFL